MSEPQGRLLGDIGGTHARLAWQRAAGDPIEQLAVLKVADFASLQDAIAHYLAQTGKPVAAAALGVASPITGDAVSMTNCPWRFSQSALQRHFGWRELRVINDFVAMALSLPFIEAAHLQGFGAGQGDSQGVRLVIGPGTGLGVAALAPLGHGRWLPIAGEGGHATLAPENDLEAAVAAWLVSRFGHAANEYVLSGPGLVNLHLALADIEGITVPERSVAQISEAADAGEPFCLRLRELFLAMLGSAAGNMALQVAATGGVYLAGGVLPRWRHVLAASPMRERFEAKGAYRPLLERIALQLIVHPQPGLLGAAAALEE